MTDPQKRKKPRYAGIQPGKKPGSWRIDYYDWRGKRRLETFTGTEADAARVKRNILVKQDRIRAGLEAPPEAPAKVVIVHQLWEAFESGGGLRSTRAVWPKAPSPGAAIPTTRSWNTIPASRPGGWTR